MIPKFSMSKDDLNQNSPRPRVVENYIGEASQNFRNFSLIHNETVRINGTVYPSLEVNLIPDNPEDPCAERLGFYWECIEYDEEQLILQLTFEDYLCVSAATNIGDLVEVTFYDQRPFIDKNLKKIQPELTITKTISRQIEPEYQEVVETILTVTVTVIAATSAWSIFTNTVMKTSLNKLISLLKNIQIVMHMMLIKVICIAHAEIYRLYIMEMVTF